jgi:hypothetical protein
MSEATLGRDRTLHQPAPRRCSAPRTSWLGGCRPQRRLTVSRKQYAGKEAKMFARITGTILLSLVVFMVVSLLVGFGVVWLTGGALRRAVIGVACGFAAAFVISTVSIAVGRNEGRPRTRAGDRSSGPEDEEDRL